MDFLHLVFGGFVALFPPVNPLGSALMVDPMLHGLAPSARQGAAKRIALYCFVICVGATLTGSWLFRLFGVSLPVVQIAGGLLICKMGWQLLGTNDVKDPDAQAATMDRDLDSVLFYPVAFPMTTGAGTISVLLTLSAHSHDAHYVAYLTNLGALLVAVTLMTIAIYLCRAYTPAILKKLGTRGEQVVNRLSAFLVFCVGLQIALSGVEALWHTSTSTAISNFSLRHD
jgi:multiple antibiotic resistance protein